MDAEKKMRTVNPFSKCAGKKLKLECPAESVIEIESAEYGNLNNKQCGGIVAQTCLENK